MNQIKTFKALAVVSQNDTGHLVKRLIEENDTLKKELQELKRRITSISRNNSRNYNLCEIFADHISSYGDEIECDRELMEYGNEPYFHSREEVIEQYPELDEENDTD